MQDDLEGQACPPSVDGDGGAPGHAHEPALDGWEATHHAPLADPTGHIPALLFPARYSWAGAGLSDAPVFVSYSFDASSYANPPDALSSAFLASFRQLTGVEKDIARDALRQWGDACGITFLEVASGNGDIRFGVYDLTLGPSPDAIGFAVAPLVMPDGFDAPSIFDDGGDIFIDHDLSAAAFAAVALHEIGHAIGLKHPHEQSPTLPPELDDTSQTVMSYKGAQPTHLGPLDIEAAQYLYGLPTRDGQQIASWSWQPQTFTLTQTGSAGADTIRGGGTNDAIFAGGGDDIILAGWKGIDVIDGGDGVDYLSLDRQTYTVGLTFSVADPAAQQQLQDGTRFVNVERLLFFGGVGVDHVTGGALVDTLFAGGGNDLLNGGGGNDSLFGEAGDDTLNGGDGDDTLNGGWGTNTLDGGDGIDFVSYAGRDSAADLNLSTGQSRAGLDYRDVLVGIEGVIGTDWGDYVVGDGVANFLFGYQGDDKLFGGGGDDVLEGGAGADELQGEGGDDTLYGGDGYDRLFGGPGADRLVGGDGEDWLFFFLFTAPTFPPIIPPATPVFVDLALGVGWGGDAEGDTYESIEHVTGFNGADWLGGSSVRNILQGGGGDDQLFGRDGNDRLVAGPGNDLLYGGAGDDELVEETDWSASPGNDRLYGEDGNDTLTGLWSVDWLDGGAGDDILSGGPGADTLLGGDGNDAITYDPADVTIDGGDGEDTLYLPYETRTVDLAAGLVEVIDDTGNSARASGFEHVFGGTGDTRISGTDLRNEFDGYVGNDHLIGRGGDDLLNGGVGDDHLEGGDGNDTLFGGRGLPSIGLGHDILDGGDGFDTASLADSITERGVSLSLSLGGPQDTGGGTNTFISIERLIGTKYADQLQAGPGGSTLVGGGGDDMLMGVGGDDTLEGGAGDDSLDGGGGTDTASYAGSSVGVKVSLAAFGPQDTSGAGFDTLTSIENLTGGAGDDFLTGDGNANRMEGGAGIDVIEGAGGADMLWGAGGNDTLHGGGGDDYLFGEAGDDQLHGGLGNDAIYGGDGADTITTGDGAANYVEAGHGDDFVTGGAGTDVIYGISGADTISGGDGADSLYGAFGAYRLDGGDGTDLLQVDSSPGVLVTGGAGEDWLVVADTAGANLFASDIENWFGYSGDDTFNAGVNSSLVYMRGGDGADTLTGGNAGDWLLGDDGADTISGAGGNDVLYGGTGADSLSGGPGVDLLYFDAADTAVSGGADFDYAVVDGAAGATLNLTAGAIEYAVGGAGEDILSAAGAAWFVEMRGGAGGDALVAGDSGSILQGEDGADHLVSGRGVDHFVGGAGTDTYWFDDNDGTDYVYDWQDGVDKVNFSQVGGASFATLVIDSAYAGANWYGVNYGSGTVWLNTGGAGTIEASDFIFA